MQNTGNGSTWGIRLFTQRLMTFRRFSVASLTITLALAFSSFPVWSSEESFRLGFLSGPISWRTPQSVTAHLSLMGYKRDAITVKERAASGTTARLVDLARELVALDVDVIVTDDAATARAAAEVTKTIPIVTLLQVDPVKIGLVKSVARPGGNITGVLMYDDASVSKKLSMLEAFVTGLKRVGVIYSPGTPHGVDVLQQAQAKASVKGIEIEPLALELRAKPNQAFEAALKANCEALLVAEGNAVWGHKGAIIDFAREHRLPTIYPFEYWVRQGEGGIVAYEPDVLDSMLALAALIDKILKGANPAELSMVQTTRFNLVVNRSAASAIGIDIPPSIIEQASRVIE